MENIKLFVSRINDTEDFYVFDVKQADEYAFNFLLNKNQIDVVNLYKDLFEHNKFIEALLLHTILKHRKVSNWFYGDLLGDRRLTQRIRKWISTFPRSGFNFNEGV